MCAAAEGKSPATIDIVAASVGLLLRFLADHGAKTEAGEVTAAHLRAFIIHLRERRCFEDHPLVKPQERSLSGATVNTYLRTLRTFFSWLVAEEIIAESPFRRVRIPLAPRKVIPTFSEEQFRRLLEVIDTSSPEGYRDYTMMLVLLDTGLRVSELTGLRLGNVSIEEGLLKVWGKGNKERVVPMGRQVARHLWRYVSLYRPEPALPRLDVVFLTRDGRPLSKDRMDNLMRKYGRRAGIAGVRISPHTLRHTAAVTFLRNGGDVFSLQRMLGHSSLDMTRRYCQLADVDVKRAHMTASPVDNLGLGLPRPRRGG